MNRLTALSKLANAYHDQLAQHGCMSEAVAILEEKFGYIRRSLTLQDLKPQPKNAEGLNPVGPKFF